MPVNGVAVRHYRDGDEVEINRSFNEIFGESRTLEEWNWKFKKNPNRTILIAVAESGGRIVGHYASISALFRYFGKIVKAGIPVDNFLHPEVRGPMRGVLRAMYEIHVELRGEHLFGFGFPKDAYYTVGKRILKYQHLSKMPVLFRRLSYHDALQRRMPWLPRLILGGVRKLSRLGVALAVQLQRTGVSSDLHISSVDEFDARVDLLWERAKTLHNIICIRDRRFLNWRYSKPGIRYRILCAEDDDKLLGFAVTGVREEPEARVGYIADLFTDGSPGVDSALVKRAILELKAQDADYILCWMLPDKAAYDALRKFGFDRRDNVFRPVNLVYQYFDAKEIEEESLKDPRNWYLTMGDSDSY